MSKHVTIRWTVEDGYAGKARPQTLTMPADDLDQMVQECESDYDATLWLADYVQEEFENRISFSITNESDVMDAWRSAKAKP